MFFIAYAFKGQVHVCAGQVKIVSHSSCRTSAILKNLNFLSPVIFLFLITDHSGNYESSQVREYFGDKLKNKNALSWVSYTCY